MTSILKVTEIQDPTNSNKALEIDSSGRILTPARPAFSVYLNTAVTSQNYTGADAVIPFDSEDFDIGSNVSISSNAVFTAPVAGLYQFNLSLLFGSISGATWLSSYFYIDGAQISSSSNLSYRNLTDPDTDAYATLASSHLIQLTATQTVTPYLRVAGDTSVDVRQGTRFSGHLVG